MANDIIAAPATATGIAAISLIRVSGASCCEKCSQLFKSKTLLENLSPNTTNYGKWLAQDGSLIDEVMVSVFHAPRSFTGEDSLEIACHGSPYIVHEIMLSLLAIGVRAANPGEFSMRAFLNGRMDLTEAEAVRDLIHSQSRLAHKQALGRLSGGLSQKIADIHAEVLNLLALLEVAIDHSEEEHGLEINDDLQKRTQSLMESCQNLLKGAKTGIMSTEGIKIALAGKPNAGKSSLLNALCGEDRAIVSDIAGTTRDVIEQSIHAEGMHLRFFDTAGIRESNDPLEQEGARRSRIQIDKADLVFWVRDASAPMDELDLEIETLTQQRPRIIIDNKSDLPQMLEGGIAVSSKNGSGLENIFSAVKDFLKSGGADPENEVLVSNIRQEGLLIQAYNQLNEAFSCLKRGDSEEFPAAHVRNARLFIEEITGKTTDDAILDRIFSQFCIGK
ncbi:MAG: tRNA uridine-5-carboxymethylaminomethyl(34) synthesis GTPase MnmE [Brevinema sp.]